MRDAVVVSEPQGFAELDAELNHLAPIEAPAGLQFFFERRAVDQFHRVKEMPVVLAPGQKLDDATASVV